MKKLFTVSFILFCSTLVAQNKINVFTGVNYSFFTDGIAGQILAEESFGLHLGISYEVPLNEKIAFRPALVFDQVGDRTPTEQGDSSDALHQMDVKLSYINIPLDFKFWNRIYVFGGPLLGILASKKAEGTNYAFITKNIDLGFKLGSGFTVNKLFFEFAIYQGFTSLGSFQSVTGNTKNIHNGYAQFAVGYRIN